VKLHLIAGARPNFMKVAPLWIGLVNHRKIRPSFIHMAQHRSDAMSKAIWRELGLPDPDHFLCWDAEDDDPIRQMMHSYERLCAVDRPDAVLVVGDVNASLAAAKVAASLKIALVHLEAGLRCFDPAVPEERNRIAIDAVSDLLLTPSAEAVENLLAEGIAPKKIRHVGNIMVDTLAMMKARIDQDETPQKFGLGKGAYVLVTLHRQGNVDDPGRLRLICEALIELSGTVDVCFVLHPRTEKCLGTLRLIDALRSAGVRLLSPMGYVGFASLMVHACVVVTDSGGVQEETSYLGVQCLTLRASTERPITITHGTNRLVETEQLANVVKHLRDASDSAKPIGRVPTDIPLWDGQTSSRVIRELEVFLLD
jgi:UDP-N-acetylglucosamine 2-epimerase (non-hydrolysing)